jgi:hypothetical protein
MATTIQTNQKVFVSPGVYTSESDLTFVAQSVGVTTLGLVGETLKGPAFEPIFITNYDEFQAFFGGTSPEKYVNTQIPKYEAAYIAKSYLQQSNQLFVTRILGLSGFDAGPSWSIKIIADVDGNEVGFDSAATPWSIDFSGNSTGSGEFVITSGNLPAQVTANYNEEYRNFNGSVSTLSTDFTSFLDSFAGNPSLTATTAIVYGSLPNADYNTLYNVQGYDITNVYGVQDVDFDNNRKNYSVNDPWYYANFDITTGDNYSGYSFYYVVTNFLTGASNTFTGTLTGNSYTLSGLCAQYKTTPVNGMVVATLRSRGISEFENSASSPKHGPQYQVTGLTDVGMVCDGDYQYVKKNPFATFLLTGITKDSQTFSFETSMKGSDSKFLNKVLGIDNFSKSRVEVPIFVEESYESSLNTLYNLGLVRGLSCDLVPLPSAQSLQSNSIAWKLEKYTSPKTPFLVSELRGNKVYDLFRFVAISDGDAANTEFKISISNISFDNKTFEVLVRAFSDTDANPIVLEKYSCSMFYNSNNFVGKQIGTLDGEFGLNSKYIMVELANELQEDALPCGFRGYTQRIYDDFTVNRIPVPIFKTTYYTPNQPVFNPPFGLTSGGDNVITVPGDNIRRTYLGVSTQFGVDNSLIQYKSKVNPNSDVWAVAVESEDFNISTKGFHMDSGATVVLKTKGVDSGTTAFYCGDYDFHSEPQTQDNGYYYIYSRKFTLCFAGGFDGWDIYREYRTNQEDFQLGARGYLAGAASQGNPRYPNTTGYGAFKPIVVNQNTVDWANTDYYAYLLGIQTFANPASLNINVFATANINLYDHHNLVDAAIDMVQYSRADSIYITTLPDYEMFTPDSNNLNFRILPQDAVDKLDTYGINSNYTSTFYPWILVKDSVTNTQVYIPPTGEVCRNLALTDNVAFPWFASAGYTRGLVNSVKARIKLTQEDRDTLYQGRINPIASFADVGTVIWGNKTLQIADTALNRLNVRRLLLQARKLISAVAIRLLFEQNDEILRQQFLDSVNPILDAIRRDRGLYDFRVTVSSSVEDLDRNTLNGRIYLKPTKALEFINIEFFITPTGASFENI